MSSPLTRSGFFDDFFKDMAPGFFVRPLHGDPLPSPAHVKVDVKENDKAYTVTAEVPGVDKKDIQVSIDGNVVSISAEVRQGDAESKDDKVLRTERYYGAISRSFSLPQEIDEASASARCEHGLLTLTLPKKSAPSKRQVTIT
jgi:HSP20 family protein